MQQQNIVQSRQDYLRATQDDHFRMRQVCIVRIYTGEEIVLLAMICATHEAKSHLLIGIARYPVKYLLFKVFNHF